MLTTEISNQINSLRVGVIGVALCAVVAAPSSAALAAAPAKASPAPASPGSETKAEPKADASPKAESAKPTPAKTMTDWDVDLAHSSVGFSVRHLMISNVRGKFGAFAGKVEIDPKNPTKSTVDVSIDTSSIDTDNVDRDKHLRSPDFFDVEKFPKMTFKSTQVQKTKKGLKVVGDLTIKGVTKKVALDVEGLTKPVKDPWGKTRMGATASTIIKRQDFGLTWNKALETGGVVVGDEVKIQLEVELVQAQ